MGNMWFILHHSEETKKFYLAAAEIEPRTTGSSGSHARLLLNNVTVYMSTSTIKVSIYPSACNQLYLSFSYTNMVNYTFLFSIYFCNLFICQYIFTRLSFSYSFPFTDLCPRVNYTNMANDTSLFLFTHLVICKSVHIQLSFKLSLLSSVCPLFKIVW